MLRLDPGASRPSTALALVLAVLLGVGLAPVGASAAGTLMTLVDPLTDDPARVATTGELQVGNDAKRPITVRGTVRVTDGDGPLDVAGTVAVTPGVRPLGAYPALPPLHLGYVREAQTSLSTRGLFGPRRVFGPLESVALSSLTVNGSALDPTNPAPGHLALATVRPVGGSCDRSGTAIVGPGILDFYFDRGDPQGGLVHLPFPQPMLVGAPPEMAGEPWCLVTVAHANTFAAARGVGALVRG